ncbi:MAG: hypothetical protein QHJ81_10035 [Anaerolineae bacterium]|nr:hypothetical protein [Anaerolineae bacterium]
MTLPHQRHSSFVLRIWWEQTDIAADSRPIWRAWVQHVASGETTYVQDVAGLLAFIERWMGRLSNADKPPPRLK